MIHLRRLLVTAAVLVVAGMTTAGTAAADPIFDLHYPNVTGSTHLAKPNVTAAIPKSDVVAKLDFANGQLVGTATIPDFTVAIKVAGLIDTRSVVRMVPVGGITGHLGDNLEVTQTFRLQLIRVFSPVAPQLNLVPRGCGTRQVSTAVLRNTTPVDIFDTTISGTFSVPRFAGCGALTPLLNLLLVGGGNTLTLRLLA